MQHVRRNVCNCPVTHWLGLCFPIVCNADGAMVRQFRNGLHVVPSPVACRLSPVSRKRTRPGSVIIFPINAPGMGRFKLFDLVGYS